MADERIVSTAAVGDQLRTDRGPNIQTETRLGGVRIHGRGKGIEEQGGERIRPLHGKGIIFVGNRRGRTALRERELGVGSGGRKHRVSSIQRGSSRGQPGELGRSQATQPLEQKLRIGADQLQDVQKIGPRAGTQLTQEVSRAVLRRRPFLQRILAMKLAPEGGIARLLDLMESMIERDEIELVVIFQAFNQTALNRGSDADQARG